ncbi:hypothetical protein [Cardiobacterium hominis]|jgi:hypothetical protein|uniref:hypothetical protein n=1 Tax=Cardiobacterium hominis TaxID=2718 RepID=UPI00248F77F1|nr:hypothetical protein [Cardiobacterium hominis]
MITFEYDDYIRELEQTAAPYANCISVSRYEDFADMFIDIGEKVISLYLGELNGEKNFYFDGLFEKRTGDIEEMKRGLLARIEAIREGI